MGCPHRERDGRARPTAAAAGRYAVGGDALKER
jgi:hypothetical protein